MASREGDILNQLKTIVERDARSPNETDDELFARLRQFDQLRPDQKLHLTSSATAVYEQAIERNIRAMKQERERLTAEIHRMAGELTRIRLRSFHFTADDGSGQMRDVLMHAVLQRVRLDELSVVMEEKRGGATASG